MTPFFGRISLDLFGTSLRGFRFFAGLAQAIVAVLGGLMAREMGGKRFAQVVAALAVAISPVSLASGALMQYVAFDYLFWVLTAYLLMRLLRTENPRLWIPIGAAIGLGMMSKYSMLFFVASIFIGLLLTDARRYLRSRWLWIGVAVSLLVFLPNLIWQIRHDFISLDFLHHIHARDIRIGRTKNFLPEQLDVPANPFTIPLWLAGLAFYFRAAAGKRYRLMGWMFVVTLLIFIVAKGRSYYMAPAYTMLLAGGSGAGGTLADGHSPVSSLAFFGQQPALFLSSGVSRRQPSLCRWLRSTRSGGRSPTRSTATSARKSAGLNW